MVHKDPFEDDPFDERKAVLFIEWKKQSGRRALNYWFLGFLALITVGALLIAGKAIFVPCIPARTASIDPALVKSLSPEALAKMQDGINAEIALRAQINQGNSETIGWARTALTTIVGAVVGFISGKSIGNDPTGSGGSGAEGSVVPPPDGKPEPGAETNGDGTG